ncbi:MAG: hypothetical protein ACPL5I_08495 [Thermodesulfobacteriota bacterium]
MKKHRREKKMLKAHNQFSAKGRRLKNFVGQAYMACRMRQGSSPCPTTCRLIPWKKSLPHDSE